MSEIRTIVMRAIHNADMAKIGKWNKPEPPPENLFDIHEIHRIGNEIVSSIEGLLSDKLIGVEK